MASNGGSTVFRLAPFTYLHVLDVTTNCTRVETGPQTFIRQDNEQVVCGPEAMITIPSRHYMVIS
jgi:major vault protein